jgi:hypothetical protein
MHLQEARALYIKQNILSADQFHEVAWQSVHTTLHGLPKMFQLFASKQVFNTAAVLHNLAKQRGHEQFGNICPSCTLVPETCEHILTCSEAGRHQNLNRQIQNIHKWLQEVDTSPDLSYLITAFLLTRGTMMDKGRPIPVEHPFIDFIRSQEIIGWRCTMEGMVSKELLRLDLSDILLPSSKLTKDRWVHGLISRLLEATHGQWIYQNLTIHDSISGLIATKGKESLLQEIETQIEQGGEGLSEHDLWMLDVNLRNLEETSGEREAYWLLAIQTARERFRISQPH